MQSRSKRDEADEIGKQPTWCRVYVGTGKIEETIVNFAKGPLLPCHGTSDRAGEDILCLLAADKHER